MKFLKWCWKQMRWYIIFLIVPDVAFGMYYWYKSERRKNSSEVKEQK